MLAARGIVVTRGRSRLLQGAELSIAPGEMVALIGPNGAGKSTLLHAISGAIMPDAGAVSLDGRPLRAFAPTLLARRRAVLPQASTLDFPLTVRDVVVLGRSPHTGIRAPGTEEQVIAAALHECDVGHLVDRAYSSLSGGERQRVQLARVLAQVWPDEGAPDGTCYLLLDEPTNNLDIAHQLRIVGAARRFAQRGTGVLTVLHNPNLAAQYADRLVVLVDGVVRQAGPPEAILTEALMRDVFDIQAVCRVHPESGRPYMLPL